MNQAELYYSGRPSWLNQMGSFSSMLILILMPFFIRDMALILIVINILAAFLIMLAIIYSRYVWEFSISGGDVQSQHGMMSKKKASIQLKNIRKIEVKQTSIQRMFSVGDVEFSAAGSSSSSIVFCGIESPFMLRDKVLRAQRKKGG